MNNERTAIVIVPTYNEAEVLPAFLARLRAEAPDFDVLVVDDGSPDGTGALADGAAALNHAVNVLHRERKDGLGAAYRAGFAWALERGYRLVGQMDCDLSHPPATLALLTAAIEGGADVALASRYVTGGGTAGWPAHRRAMSQVGCLAARVALGLPYADMSGGYKLWTADALRRVEVASTISDGYVFQVESTQRAHLAGLSVAQVPFVFTERVAGESKMRPAIALEGARVLAHLRRDPWRATTV